MAQRQWTQAQRLEQAQKIKTWQPWQHSTGAKTAEGKARCSQNANKGKGALMARIKELRRDLMMEIEQSEEFIKATQTIIKTDKT